MKCRATPETGRATVDVVSLQAGEIKGLNKKDWGRPVQVDKVLDQVSSKDYDAVILPRGQINPDLLRVEPNGAVHQGHL